VLTLALVFVFLASITTMFDGALVSLGRWESENILRNTPLKAYNFLARFFKNKTQFQGLRLLLKTAKYTFRLLFGLTGFLYLAQKDLRDTVNFLSLLKAGLLIILLSYVIDFISAFLYYKKPKTCLKVLEIPLTLILCPFLPFALFGFLVMSAFHPEIFKPKPLTSKQVSEKIRQILEESGLVDYLDPSDRRLMMSLVYFKDRIAREIMVPRIKVFSLDIKCPVQTAVNQVLEEGYSRVPIYEGNVDNIVGILLLKDLLSFYASTESDLDPRLQQSIEFLVKPATFTPETKKISHLLQEFRLKQTHLAIVVDEWGGTEGIVSIEDILEELVGEIADEYDINEEAFFTPLAAGGWIVDARMSIKDIENELGIAIPTGPEYDTLGGYIFHKAGEIPQAGYKIHHAAFNLEVLSTSERSVDKVKISK